MSETVAAAVNIWIGWGEVLWGVASLAYGLRARGEPGDMVAPLGAVFLLTGLFHLLSHTVPLSIPIALGAPVYLAAVVWFVIRARASRSRLRALKQRNARQT